MMTTPQRQSSTAADPTNSKESREQRLQRRGLLAAAAALVAGLVAKLSEQTVHAGADGDVVLGTTNTTGLITNITNTTASSTGLETVNIAGTNGWGLETQGSGFGVIGRANGAGIANGAGVYGETSRSDSFGVQGNASSGQGVRGTSSSNYGVFGQSTSGNAIFGQVTAGSSANTIAIYGLNNSTYAGGAPGAGGFAIYGLCAKGHGLVGATAAAGAAAVVGASNGVAGAYAAAFYGPVAVSGNFTVVSGAKSAAVPHPDGSHRRLYCMESPESWFEDFGTGRLECGRADITIDPDFAAVVDLSDYHVFLTGYDSEDLLHVKERTPAGFRVEANATVAALQSRKDGDLNGTFSWRVVAKRKDIRGERLEHVTIPKEPALPPVPDIPDAPSPAQARR